MDAPIVRMNEDRPLTLAFWSHVDKSNAGGCWVWTGYVAKHGYGKACYEGQRVYAHRLSWEIHNGKLSPADVIDHLCYNRSCVNPRHLRSCSHAENIQNAPGLRSDNSTGYRNVYFHKRSGRFYVRVTAFGKAHYGGYFATPEDANERAIEMRTELHPMP